MLWFWWATLILLSILNRVVAQDWRSAATAHAIRSATRLDIASEVTSIVAAGFAIAVVGTLTNRQSERARGRLR